jgi:hypothetical protein
MWPAWAIKRGSAAATCFGAAQQIEWYNRQRGDVFRSIGLCMNTAAQTYAMLGNQTLWDAAQQCHEALRQAQIAHAVVGGVAVCLHGYQRNTVDLDLLVRRNDSAQIRQALDKSDFDWRAETSEFRSPGGIPVHLLMAGDRVGDDSELSLPDPGDPASIVELEGLPVLTLQRLIESKIACGLGDLRRTHKDFADVVELIARHGLSRGDARRLHKSVRKTFSELVVHARRGAP